MRTLVEIQEPVGVARELVYKAEEGKGFIIRILKSVAPYDQKEPVMFLYADRVQVNGNSVILEYQGKIISAFEMYILGCEFDLEAK